MDTPDRCWKWGFFYVNREDPSILVPKRYGIGYTLNFGNGCSWAALALILIAVKLPFLVPVFFIEQLRRMRG